MKASQLIEMLQEAIEDHGDLAVFVYVKEGHTAEATTLIDSHGSSTLPGGGWDEFILATG